METFMVAATVASAAMSYQAAQDQADTTEATGRYNTRLAENEAVRTRNKGVEEENKHREKVRLLHSKQRAQLGASSLDMTSGSPLDLQAETLVKGEADALRIRSNFGDEANALDNKGKITTFESNAKAGGIRSNANASLLSSSAKVGSQWYDYTIN